MKRDNEEMTLPAAKASRCLSPPNAFHTSAAKWHRAGKHGFFQALVMIPPTGGEQGVKTRLLLATGFSFGRQGREDIH